ncbi:MAG TPA: winged helix-turn-helix domain-containing protein, partial [Pyrinomonadaceae bacterium]|nr:winged helix-turn-helix domain-containing protein [Pyrinomonadaceae bacterium]
MKEKHLYRFGEFTLNAEDHILTRGGENVPVTPKMFDLLLVFVQNPGRVLGKEFLLNSVWPDSFVEEGNITFNIRQLRKALDDNAQSPIFIETIPRRGYRFVAPVEALSSFEEESETPDAEPAATAADFQPGSRRRYLVPAVVTFAVLAGAAAMSAWFFRDKTTAGAPILSAPFQSEKLSTDGDVYHIAMSLDAKNVVYTHRAAGKQGLWLRQLDTSTNVPIIPPSDDFYGGLVISPDGSTVYFARGRPPQPQLNVYRMAIFGGVPQKVVDSTQGWISVSGDGRRVSFVRCNYQEEDWCSLYVADAADGGNEKKLVTHPRPIRIGDNKISPDGKRVAFAAGQSRTSSSEFAAYEVDIDTGVVRQFMPQKFFNINYIAWLPDQNGFLMTAMQVPENNYRIWHVTSTGEVIKMTTDSESYSRLSLDATGSILVSTLVDPDFRLMLFKTDEPDRDPIQVGNASSVAIGPDGTVYFSSLRTGNSELWRTNADGSDQRQLTNDPAAEVAPMVSPDAKTIFFASNRTGTNHIWEMSTDGSNQRQLTKDEGGLPVRVSPDGEWLYYRAGLSGAMRRVSRTTGRDEPVLKERGRHLNLSPDLTMAA